MRHFLKPLSYLFHPLFAPLAGCIPVVLLNPLYREQKESWPLFLAFLVITIVIPLIVYALLRSMGVLQSVFAPSVAERKYPLMISVALYLGLIYRFLPDLGTAEIYFYMVGLCMALTTALALLFMRLRISIHMLCMGAVLVFLIGLSLHFEKNITGAIAIWTLLTGLVASSRLAMQAHSKVELSLGLFIGGLAQLLTYTYWV